MHDVCANVVIPVRHVARHYHSGGSCRGQAVTIAGRLAAATVEHTWRKATVLADTNRDNSREKQRQRRKDQHQDVRYVFYMRM